MSFRTSGFGLLPALILAATAWSQALPPELKSKIDAQIKHYQSWSNDPAIVSAVKARNSTPAPQDKTMTNEKWAQLTLLDPYVRSFSKNPLGQYLKSKKEDVIAECFVSAADGTKVAFLSKTTNWSHADKEKHRTPMAGRIYTGPVVADESTGQQLVQIGLPVLDGGRPIGSIVLGLAVSKL